MAPMITDTYSKYSNSEFGGGVNKQPFYTSSKPPLPSMSYTSDQQHSKYNSLNDSSLNSFNIGILDGSSVKRRSLTEENIIEVLRGKTCTRIIFENKKKLIYILPLNIVKSRVKCRIRCILG